MSFQHIPGVGLVHFNEVKPTRVVPGNERHKWANGKLGWGEQTTCVKCGCVKQRKRPEYEERYTMPGCATVTERPACAANTNPIPTPNQP